MARRGPDENSREADVTPLDTADGQSTPPYGTIPPPPLSMHHVGVYVLILHRHTTNIGYGPVVTHYGYWGGSLPLLLARHRPLPSARYSHSSLSPLNSTHYV